jgi:hypothetical protein
MSSTVSSISRLSVILGWLSIFSFIGLILPIIFPIGNAYAQLFLAYLPFPGLLCGLSAVITGIIAYAIRGAQTSLWGIALGAVTIIAVIILFVTPAGGVPFFCSNDYGCSALKNGSQCTADLFFLPHGLQEIFYSIHAGVCIQPSSSPRIQ